MRRQPALVFIASILAPLAQAQTERETPPAPDENIVVTATRNPLPSRELGATVTIISREDIEASGAQTVGEVLDGLPGISLRRSGWSGGNTSIMIRGDKGGHTMVMIDGVEYADPSDPEKSFDIGDLPVHDIDRIEIVKGPHSVAYGASGLSGVVHIITKRPQPGTHMNVGFEIGSYDTYGTRAGVSGREGAFGYAAHIAGSTTGGFSTNASREHGESDGYLRRDASLRLQYATDQLYNADLVLRAANGVADIDGGTGVDDPNYQVQKEDINAQLTQKFRYLDRFETRVVSAISQNDRHFQNDPDTISPSNWVRNRYQSERRLLDVSELITFAADHTLVASAQWVRDTAKVGAESTSSWGPYNEAFAEQKVHERSFALQYQWGLWDRVFGQVGARTLDNSDFGEQKVGQAALHVVLLPEWTSLRLNYGRGFKTPSVYQLYSPNSGSADLEPEKVLTIEGGIEQKLATGLTASITGFQNKTDNLIEYNYDTFHYYNVNTAIIKGFESQINWEVSDALSAEAQYTHLKTLDRETNKALAMRPDNSYGAAVTWKPKAFVWKTSLRGQNRSRAGFDPTSKGFRVVDTALSLREGPTLVTLKVSNLLNSWYQEVYGYNTPARSYLVSADYSY